MHSHLPLPVVVMLHQCHLRCCTWPTLKHHCPPTDSKPLTRHELEVLVHEAGGELVTDMSAAVAAAEQGAAAAAAAAALSASSLQLTMPVQPPPRPTLYVLASGRDAAEVAELAVSLQALKELCPAAVHTDGLRKVIRNRTHVPARCCSAYRDGNLRLCRGEQGCWCCAHTGCWTPFRQCAFYRHEPTS